jgi:hypothetical protein
VTRARTFIARFVTGIALLLAGLLVYMYVESRPTAQARLAMQTDATVRVTVRPQDEPVAVPRAAAGLLFLPGSPVDPIAYAPLARAIAARGHSTAIVSLPHRGLPSAKSRHNSGSTDGIRSTAHRRLAMQGK